MGADAIVAADHGSAALDLLELVEGNLGLARWIVSREFRVRSRNARADIRDVHQAAALGLVEAARRYEPARGSFATYAGWWIRKRAREECERAERALPTVDTTDRIPADRGGGDPWARIGAVWDAVYRLPAAWRHAVELRYGLDGGGERSIADIAKAVRRRKEWVRDVLAAASPILRPALGGGDGENE